MQIHKNSLAHTTISVFNGCNTSFWRDKWLANYCLKDLFPNVYSLNLLQEKTVDRALVELCAFRRNLNDWEVDTLVELYRTQEEFKRIQERYDRVWWQVHGSGSFRVLLKLLSRDMQQVANGPWENICKVKTPYKVAFLVGLVVSHVSGADSCIP